MKARPCPTMKCLGSDVTKPCCWGAIPVVVVLSEVGASMQVFEVVASFWHPGDAAVQAICTAASCKLLACLHDAAVQIRTSGSAVV